MSRRQGASMGQLVSDHETSVARAKSSARDILKVKVWSPFRTYYDGEATSISGINATGTFDILPKHHSFITLLEPCDLMLQTRDGEFKIKISGGVMRVHSNIVVVFLEV